MPTSSRLISALLYAVLAWVVSGMVVGIIEEQTQRTNFGHFQLVNAAIGLLVGWVVVGKRLGSDYITAMGIGFTGMATVVFWCLFAHSFSEMLRLSLARRYDGPFEAIIAIFKLGIGYGSYLVDKVVLITLTIGGMLAGVLAEYTHRRWE